MLRPCSPRLCQVVLAATLAGLGLFSCAHRPPAAIHVVAPAPPLALGGDLHQHLTMRFAVPFFGGGPGDPMTENPNNRLGNQLSVAALRRAGLRVIVAAVWPPPGRDELVEVRRQLRLLEDFATSHPAFALCHTAAEARRALAVGRIALIPGVEGAGAITQVSDVDRLFAAGVRVVGLVHFFDNALADARDDQLGPLGVFTNGRAFGLTPLGRAAVTRMAQLGMMVDLDHASSRTVQETLDVLEPLGVPAIVSHAGAAMHAPRTLDDAQAVRLARTGGLIGIGLYRDDRLQPTAREDRFEGFEDGTCDELVAHWAHYARLVGPEHVLLGSDLNSVIDRARPGGYCPDGLRNATDLPYLFAGVVAQGVPREALDQSGERLLELLARLERLAVDRPQPSVELRRGLFDVGQ